MAIASQDPLVAQLMQVLGLPKMTRRFVLTAEVGNALTVECEYYPERWLDPIVGRYRLV